MLRGILNEITASDYDKIIENPETNEVLGLTLIKVGIYPNLKGYDYLMAAIKLSIYNPQLLKNVTNMLYPVVADYFGVSQCGVEKAIRHAVDNAGRRGLLNNADKFLGRELFADCARPTSAEFISIIVFRFSNKFGNSDKWLAKNCVY